MLVKNTRSIKLHTFSDSRGKVSVAEGEKDIPFKIERTFHIYGVPQGEERGGHAHRETEQVYVCLNGSVTVILNDGTNKEEITLRDPEQVLYVGPLVWSVLKDFQPGTVLFVWTSKHYDATDYIREYDEFIKTAK
jgi:dTDP-4-dehydrorhamnose 3,5-epimerase-like enzyme